MLAFLFGLFAAFYFSGCFNKMNTVYIKGKDVLKIDTVKVEKTYTKYIKGKDIRIYTQIHDTVKHRVVDTFEIVGEYFTQNVYADTLKFDDGYVSVTDTISRNKIQGRSYKAQIGHTLAIVERKPKTALFWGIGASKSPISTDASIHLFLETPSRRLYGIGAGLDNHGNLVYKANILIKF